MGNFCIKASATDKKDINSQKLGGSSKNLQRNAIISTIAPSQPTALAITFSFRKNIFTREELEKATNGFSDANFLGRGGFGNVHKGVLDDGRRVAIKQLIIGSKQGDREFQTEVEIISRVHHRHLVTLVGWSIAEGERMLVYEFVPMNTLKFHLHGSPKIIHRDIKADNILLDLNYEAKIADFGLARIFPDDQTHVEATKIAGTIGYLDPQYASTGELTDKSDVYSFGVILLELVTGFQPLFKTIVRSRNSLVAWAWPFLEDHNYDGLVDARLQKSYSSEELTRVVECAAACLRVSSPSRPRMSQVVRVLEGHSSVDILKEGIVRGRSINYTPNGFSTENTISRSSTLDPAMPEHGTSNFTGSETYFSIISNQVDQGNETSSQGPQSSHVKTMEMWTV